MSPWAALLNTSGFFFFQAEDGIRDYKVTGVQTCALPIYHADPGIFIRSMATRGTSGGLAQATGDVATLLDAAGKDFVIIETVGVGQDEVEIAGVAQVTVVVLVPGMGDDIQAIKAGIMEIADVFVINKSDQPGAERMEREIQSALSLAQNGQTPPIIRTIATDGTGVPELLKAVSSPPRP